jgi:hypothetical protein
LQQGQPKSDCGGLCRALERLGYAASFFWRQALLEALIMIRLLFVVPFVVLASAASAQQQPGHDACARDVSRLCRPYMNSGDSAVLACLQQNRARISRACDKVLREHGQ